MQPQEKKNDSQLSPVYFICGHHSDLVWRRTYSEADQVRKEQTEHLIRIAEKNPEEKSKIKFKVPWFIPGFLIAAALVTWIPVLKPAGVFVKDLSKFFMIVTLFLIGSNLSREKLKELGLRPVLQGLILWGILSVAWCIAIYSSWINCSK